MPDYSRNIVYLSDAQRQELFENDTITVNGTTVTYNDNDIYVTPQAEPITDVKINGTSIGSNGVADIPKATSSTLGVVTSAGELFGTYIDNNGGIAVATATSVNIKNGTTSNKPVAPQRQHESVFYGLTKAAGVDLANDANATVGTYPDSSKAAIQNMLGITNLISTEESSTATAAHAANSTFMMNGKLHRATAAIAIGDAVEVGTNCEVVKADEVFVKNTDYATENTCGLVKVNPNYGIAYFSNNDKTLTLVPATSSLIKAGINSVKPLVPYNQHQSVFYGLSKVAGVDLANETITLGTYPETSKTAIRSLIGAAAASDIPSIPVQDIQVNGSSILDQGIANIPIADANTYGTAKVGNGGTYGIEINSNGILQTTAAGTATIKAGTNGKQIIAPSRQHDSVFYGLAKAAGADMASSDNAVGTYTDAAKAAIRNMLGATSSNVIAVQDEQPTDSDTKVWLPETEAQGIQVPTYEEFQALDNNTVKKTDYATNGGSAGLIKISGNGLVISSQGNGLLLISAATAAQIKAGNSAYYPIVPSNQDASVFYGLAKAAGDVTQSVSTNAVGTYTDDAKAAIQTMLGVPGDVQINGVSIINNGIANIPFADSENAGVGKLNNAYGITRSSGGIFQTYAATDENIKTGTSNYRPIVPIKQHQAVFYGLATAAGDTTQSVSSNAVGTYTTEAKAAIHTMLGIDPASIAAQVDIPLVETVSGTTPTITGQPNVRYVCGEVSTITITPPASGSVDVIFESGSTATTMTVPSTVKWPAWFDAEALEANTTYEVLITDGIYGSVMTWAT